MTGAAFHSEDREVLGTSSGDERWACHVMKLVMRVGNERMKRTDRIPIYWHIVTLITHHWQSRHSNPYGTSRDAHRRRKKLFHRFRGFEENAGTEEKRKGIICSFNVLSARSCPLEFNCPDKLIRHEGLGSSHSLSAYPEASILFPSALMHLLIPFASVHIGSIHYVSPSSCISFFRSIFALE